MNDIVAPKKKRGSKKKGNRWELELSNELSEMFNDTFRRVPNSGAFTGGMNRNKYTNLNTQAQNTLTSDIMTPDWFEFSIECKNYQDDPRVDNLLLPTGDKQIDKWLVQAMGDATYVKKQYILIMNSTGLRRSFVCLSHEFFLKMCAKINKTPISHTIYQTSHVFLDKDYFFHEFLKPYYADKINSSINIVTEV